MGSKPRPSPPPTIIYTPPPPAPSAPTSVPTQSLTTQTALNEVSGKQTRLNMELGAQLDRTNAEFLAGQDIRRSQSASAEQRLTQKAAGDIETGLTRVRGQEDRAGIAATGAEYRAGLATAGQEERRTIGTTGTETRATERVRGTEQRAGIRESGSEQRTTALQQEMFRRYKENRDFEQAQSQYRS